MKTVLQFIFCLCISISISAQSTVQIQINHLLEGEMFELNTEAKNNLNNDFMLDRLEYYLSTFSIVHDGGQVTPIEGLYVLVGMIDGDEAVESTTIELGEFDIQEIEAVNFYFGIDEEANHADPALWPEGHPLAPRFPSMHWGWAAGYRFIALEGMSGPAIDQELQFHCIGDEFYEELSFPVSMSGQDTYTVEIDAEYSNLLSDIDISGGLILHGNLGHIMTLATNLKTNVFTAVEVTSVEEDEIGQSFEVFPNPSLSGFVNFKVETNGQNLMVQIFDVLGKEVIRTNPNTNQVHLQESGLYYANLTDENGNTLATRKFIVH